MNNQRQGDEQGFLKRYLPTAILFLLIMVVYAAFAWSLIYTGELNADEGFYCLAAEKVIEGQVPYRDFAYSQTPVLPYVNGLAMKILGFGYLQQRTINAFWGFLTLAITFYIGLRCTDKAAGLMAIWTTAASLFWIHFICMGKTYAATGLFLILAMLGISVPRSYYKKVLVFSIAGALAIGCRFTAAPAVFVLWLFLLLQAETTKNRVIGIVLPIFVQIMLLLPFLLANSENFIFWNISYHLGSSFNRRGWLSIRESLCLAPAVLVIITAGTILVILKLRQFKIQELSALFAAIAGIATQLSLKSAYGETLVPFIPLGAVGAATILSKWKYFRELCFAVLIFSMLAWSGPRPTTSDSTLKALFNTAKFVNANTTPEGPVLTSLPIIAIEAQRKVFENLEMGMFSLTSEIPEEKARRLHLVTPRILTELVETQKAKAIVLHSFPSLWNFYWSVPSLKKADPEQMSFFLQALNKYYNIAFVEHPFAVFLPKSDR